MTIEKTIGQSVEERVSTYLSMMDDEPIDDLYDLVLAEVEEPLLRLLLVHTGQNQSRTAAMLGMNRGTLRKKLRKYQLL